MRNIIPYLLFLATLIASCKKDKELDVVKKHAQFEFKDYCRPNEYFNTDTVHYIGDVFIFDNRSDTSSGVSYQWQFGDGTSSSAKNPTHIYTLPGTYKVSLITYFNNVPSDTFVRYAKAIIGIRHFKNLTETIGVDFQELADKSIISLGLQNPYKSDQSYVIIKADSLLTKTGTTTIPGANIRLESMEKTTDGKFILAGNGTPGNTDQFSLSKMDINGNFSWVKYYSNTTGKNNHAIQTSDGGFITIGSNLRNTTLGQVSISLVIKTDAEGNETWRKSFDHGGDFGFLSYADNILESENNYIFCGRKQDSIFLNVLNNSGQISFQEKLKIADPVSFYRVGIAKAGNTYAAYLVNNGTILLYNSDFSFKKSITQSERELVQLVGSGNRYYSISGLTQYSFATEITENYTENWKRVLGNWMTISCTSSTFGGNRHANKIRLSSSGDILTMIYGPDNTTISNSRAFYLARLDKLGNYR